VAVERGVHSGNQPPGSMALVMSLLAAEQQDIKSLMGNDLKEELKRVDKVPNLSNSGMFAMHPDEPGADMRVLEDVTTLIEYCAAYGIGHLSMEKKFHLFISSAFAKEFRKLWQAAYRDVNWCRNDIFEN